MASIAGRFAFPMSSPYVVSKFAVEGYSECINIYLAQPPQFARLVCLHYLQKIGVSKVFWTSTPPPGILPFNEQFFIKMLQFYAIGASLLIPSLF